MVYTSPSSLATVCLCFTNQTLPLCTNLVEAELENSMFLSKIEQDCLGGTQTSDTEARQLRRTVIFSRKKKRWKVTQEHRTANEMHTQNQCYGILWIILLMESDTFMGNSLTFCVCLWAPISKVVTLTIVVLLINTLEGTGWQSTEVS